MREQLLGHLLGALDDAEHEVVESRLQHDPRLCEEVTALRRQLEVLQPGRRQFDPPADLAERTCQMVFSHSEPAPARPRRRRMSPAAAIPAWIARAGWRDLAVAVAVVLTASLLVFPAVLSSRVRARLVACQDNLRAIGVGMTSYSQAHDNFFPEIPTRGKLAAAGIYAPKLLGERYLSEAHRLVCPDSPLAERGDFRLPSFDELRRATSKELRRLRKTMGGSYGYTLGYVRDGVYQQTKNLRRPHFALVADAPSLDLPGHRTLDHGGLGQNVLFEDGRVDFVSSTKCSDLGDDFFANDDGLVAPGVHPDDAVIVPSGTRPVAY